MPSILDPARLEGAGIEETMKKNKAIYLQSCWYLFNPLGPGGTFMVQKMDITSPIPFLKVNNMKLKRAKEQKSADFQKYFKDWRKHQHKGA